MDPVVTPSNAPAAATPVPSSGTGGQTASASSRQAFQMALSAALNPPNVLGDAGGDSDDDDGSSLTVRNSTAL